MKETIMAHVGVNIGSSTVKVVALHGSERRSRVVPHLGQPVRVLEGLLAAPDFAGTRSFAVSGQVDVHIQQVLEHAAKKTKPLRDAADRLALFLKSAVAERKG